MIIIVGIAYIAAAAVAMYWTIKIQNLKGTPYFDEDNATIIAMFWPVAFPLYLAYMLAGFKSEDE